MNFKVQKHKKNKIKIKYYKEAEDSNENKIEVVSREEIIGIDDLEDNIAECKKNIDYLQDKLLQLQNIKKEINKRN